MRENQKSGFKEDCLFHQVLTSKVFFCCIVSCNVSLSRLLLRTTISMNFSTELIMKKIEFFSLKYWMSFDGTVNSNLKSLKWLSHCRRKRFGQPTLISYCIFHCKNLFFMIERDIKLWISIYVGPSHSLPAFFVKQLSIIR
jgi:hypothetical protein